MMKKIRPKYQKMIGGATDTEHLAALYFSYLDRELPDEYFGASKEKKYSARAMWFAMQRAVDKVEEIQVKLFRKKLNNTFNLCASRCLLLSSSYKRTKGRSQWRKSSRPLLPDECLGPAFYSFCLLQGWRPGEPPIEIFREGREENERVTTHRGGD
jgi:hypothetical protein